MIELKNISKTFTTATGDFEALDDVSITIPDGDIFGIIGMSGAGKSTLVRCINMLERPTSGTVVIDGQDICTLSEKKLRDIRRDITMIFQSFNLLMQRNVLKNVCFPLEIAGLPRDKARARALELLEIVGLEDKAYSYPAQLSGGQQQRVAIARALATDPKVLLCDEATSALDPNTTNSILELIRDINRKMNITVVIITHQMSVVENVCKHVAILDHGKVVEQGDVGEIFANPKSDAAKQLVYPDGDADTFIQAASDDKFIRVVFDGAEAARKPMIARMAVEIGIDANIAYASTRSINGKAYGSMILSIAGGQANVDRAIAYLTQTKDILVQEVEINV